MQTVMKHNFQLQPQVHIPRSVFNRSHGCKTTFDSGYLVPIYVDEALPGDTFKLRCTAFARMSTPKYPLMDNLYLDTFFFAVPLRLIWANFKKAMGEQINPGDSTSYLAPVAVSPASTGHAVGTLQDYMSIPTGVPDLTYVNLWCRAYNLIWNEWFRDENLQNSVTVDTGDGPDTVGNYTLLRRGKRFDYFTSLLPWPQKATAAVTLPLGTRADVKGIGILSGGFGTAASQTLNETGGAQRTASGYLIEGSSSGLSGNEAYVGLKMQTTGYPDVWADLSTATAATLNEWRQALQLQSLYERDARGGTRYTELIRSHFGVVSPDARLQRPEYLGGSSAPIAVHPVATTAFASGSNGPGQLGAFATVVSKGSGFTHSFTEHCVVLGLANVRADLNYQQGLNKMFSRRTRADFYWPTLATIGEQAVLTKEIYAVGSGGSTDDNVLGYAERYAEYRFKNSVITGLFRSQAPSTIDVWHVAQKFTSAPTLNSTFIQDTPPISRVVVVNTEPQFLFDSYFDLTCVRPMPVYGIPANFRF